MATAQIPGNGWTRAGDGDFPNENPAGWEMLKAYATRRRHGAHGFSMSVPVCEPTRQPLDDLRDYMDHVAGAMWAALPDQHGDPQSYRSVRSEAEAATKTCQRITEALGDDWTPRP